MILEKNDERNGRKVRNGDVPLVFLPTNETEELFQVSAEAERALFPDEYSRDSIWNDFVTKVNTALLCDVDIQAVLSDKSW